MADASEHVCSHGEVTYPVGRGPIRWWKSGRAVARCPAMDAPTDDAPVRRRGVALAPLRHRNFALVWSAGLISNVGTWMETVAVGSLAPLSTAPRG